MEDEIVSDNFEIEPEWKRIEQLLGQRSEASWILAMIEAHKIFRRVLEEVSFGETTDDQIHNAGELFEDMTTVFWTDEVYREITNKVGYRIKRAEAQKMTDVLLQAILAMVGRDFEPKGFWHRLANSADFFWGHHPRILAGSVAGLLVFVILVWFLANTAAGQWLVELAVGFSGFILSGTVLIVFLLVVLLISVILSFTYLERHRRN